MDNKLNGFNNGRDTTDGVGGKPLFGYAEKQNEYPKVCPVTGRDFIDAIQNELGEVVPTYGSVFDSYTIPVKDEDGTWYCQRFDHDLGGWIGDEDVDERLILIK